MKVLGIINRYILRETAVTYLYTVCSFMFLLYIGAFLKQMEMGLPLTRIAANSPFLILVNLPFVLPLGFITGYILTFSRLSVDREIQIIRASGVSLARVIIPHLCIALAVAAAASVVYQDVIPRSRRAFQEKMATMYRDIPPVPETYNRPSLLLNHGRDRINVISKEGEEIRGLVIQHIENGRLTQVTFAEQACITRRSREYLRFEMQDVSRLILNDTYVDHPSFRELNVDVALAEDQTAAAAGNDYTLMTGTELRQVWRDSHEPVIRRRKAAIQYWMRLSLAMACFAFTIFAIPAGIRSDQKSKTSGFVRSILYALVIFFPLLMGLRSVLNVRPELPANLMLLPNWLFIGVGAYLLRKVSKL